MWTVIKIIIGLFIWLALPEIICKKWKIKRNTRKFVNIACKIMGIAVIVYAVIDWVVFFINGK